ncbi:MAG TPA: ATP-dependent DNA helicase [Candidatus Dormibacteraeota bacterium]|nr:ATP-dependent DNA helicase [Candidatus Dormibacteraeota bacterium]
MSDRPTAPRWSLGDLGGPTRVVGGPRSGKTQQLVDLAAEWLTGGGDPKRLVLVVRSRDGAAYLQRRVEAQLTRAHPTFLVHTHEGLARSVLVALATKPDSDRPLSATGEWLAMREALRRAAPLPRLGPLVDEPSCTKDAIDLVSACKRALVGPGLLAERLRRAPDSLVELAVVAHSYELVLAEMKSHDRRDLHKLALELLLGDPSALRGWADLLLVDDAEDLSPAQWLLIRELSGRLSAPRRLVMAGHWSESTPGFRGVSSESSSRPFEEYFPSELAPRDWVLPTALPRWTAEVAETLGLDLGGDAAGGGLAELEPLGEAAFRLGAGARVWVAADETEEALAVAREIVRAHLQGEIEFGEVAILVRAHSRQLVPIEAALATLGVPYRGALGRVAGGHPLVTVALNWLRVLCWPGDDGVLLAALAAGPRAVSPAALRVLRRSAGRRDVPAHRVFWEWANSQAEPESEVGRGSEREKWAQLRGAGRPWLDLLASAPQHVSPEVSWSQLRALLGQVELASGIAAVAVEDWEMAAGLAEFARTAEAVAEVQGRLGRGVLTLPRWLEELQLVLRHAGGETESVFEERRSQVEVLTVREAKGRSWPRVFLCGCAAGTIPAPPESGGLLDVEELQELVRRVPELEDVLSSGEGQQDAEARLFLVALTRATSEVTCSWARRYQGRVAERSPFLGLLIAVGQGETPAPHAELVHEDDLATELALATSAPPALGEPGALRRAATELRQALAPWDPVADGVAVVGEPLSISATSVAAWLACPRQYLAGLLTSPIEVAVNLTLGTQAHRLLEHLYRQRAVWEGRPLAFRALADQLVREQLMPEVRAEQPDALQVVYVRLWLERLVGRWGERIVAAGTAKVGEPIAEEVAFDLLRDGWRLRGKVDALWRHPNGEVELLDYKTSRTLASDRALRTEVFGKPPDGPQQWQLPIYQLAARGGAFAEQLGEELPSRVRNWYVGADPGPRDPDPIPASGFRIVDRAESGESGTLTELELDRIEQEIDRLAQAILSGRFPAQPRHSQRTCRDGRIGCAVAFWCDGEGSAGSGFPTPTPHL